MPWRSIKRRRARYKASKALKRYLYAWIHGVHVCMNIWCACVHEYMVCMYAWIIWCACMHDGYLLFVCMHMSIYTYACNEVCIHVQTQTNTYTHANTQTHIRWDVHYAHKTHTHTQTHMHYIMLTKHTHMHLYVSRSVVNMAQAPTWRNSAISWSLQLSRRQSTSTTLAVSVIMAMFDTTWTYP